MMRWFRSLPVDRQSHWEKVYRRQAADELSWFQERPETSLRLIERCGLGSEAGVIDVGGGDSRLVDSLLDQGFVDLTVLDLSAAALERARARLGARAGSVAWIAADVTSFRARRTFDLWHDRAVFHFLTEAADRQGYVAALDRALRPGGHAVVATFSQRGPRKCSGLPVCRYSAASLAGELGPEYALRESFEEVHVTPTRHRQSFLFCRFVRSAG